MGARSGRKGPDPLPIERRFWAKVTITPAPVDVEQLGPCLLWTGATQRGGYGKFAVGRGCGTVIAHRFAWRLVNGTEPPAPLDHLCRRTACVAVGHLEHVTTGENNRRSWAARKAAA